MSFPLGENTSPFLLAATLIPSTAARSSPLSRPRHLHLFLPNTTLLFSGAPAPFTLV